MPSREPASRRKLRADCAELSPEDGADPRLYFRSRTEDFAPGPMAAELSRPPVPRKTQQLCAQTARVLAYGLAGDSRDEILADLDVVSVSPAPDSSQLLVTVTLRPGAEPHPAAVIAQRLQQASARLREEVSAAITRRRAPRLVFQFVSGQPEASP
jgi:ribosome-binding factor A